MVLAEIADVAGLVARVDLAAAVDNARGSLRLGGFPGGDFGLFAGPDVRLVGVRQQIVAERGALAGCIDAGLDRSQPPDGARRVLVAQRHQDGRRGRDRRRLVAGGHVRGNAGHTVARAMQEPEADDSVPEAQHRPRRADGKAEEHHPADDRPAAGREDLRRNRQHRDVGRDVEHDDQPAPASNLGRCLNAGRCPIAAARLAHDNLARVLGGGRDGRVGLRIGVRHRAACYQAVGRQAVCHRAWHHRVWRRRGRQDQGQEFSLWNRRVNRAALSHNATWPARCGTCGPASPKCGPRPCRRSAPVSRVWLRSIPD